MKKGGWREIDRKTTRETARESREWKEESERRKGRIQRPEGNETSDWR